MRGSYLHLIRNQVGGSLLSSMLNVGRTLLPTIGKTLGLSALAGLASEGASKAVKKVSGSGQTGGFIVPQNHLNQLLSYAYLLTKMQKGNLANALNTGNDFSIKPTAKQRGGFQGTLLASIGIPMLLNAITGKGARRIGRLPLAGGASPQIGPPTPAPFVGTWSCVGRAKKRSKEKVSY